MSAQERPRVPRSAQESSFGRRSGEASLRVAGAAVVPFRRGVGDNDGGDGDVMLLVMATVVVGIMMMRA